MIRSLLARFTGGAEHDGEASPADSEASDRDGAPGTADGGPDGGNSGDSDGTDGGFLRSRLDASVLEAHGARTVETEQADEELEEQVRLHEEQRRDG